MAMIRHNRSANAALAIPALALAFTLLVPAGAAVAAPATWSAAEDRSLFGVPAYAPEIASASDGSLTAIWAQDSPIVVQVSRSMDGGFTWSAPTTLSTGSTISRPDIAAGTDGSVVAVWTHYDGAFNIIQTSRFDGVAWSPAINLSATGSNASVPQVAAAPDGRFVAAWQRLDASAIDGVQVSNFDGAAWSAPQYLSDGSLPATAPRVAVTAGGTRTVVWPVTSGSYGRIQVSTSVDDGASWSTPQFLTPDLKLAYTPQVAAASDGTLNAVWVLDNLVEVSHSIDGLTWSAGQVIGGSGTAREPHIAIAPDNSRMIVSRKHDGTNYRVQALRSTDGITWDAPGFISPAGEVVFEPHLSASSSSDFAAVWQHGSILNTTVKASIFDDAAWEATPTILSDTGQRSGVPRVTGSVGGSFATIWLSRIGSGYDTAKSAFTTMGPTITSPTPSSGTVGQPYSFQVTADGNPTATFSLSNGALPAGLSMSPAGLISGTPTSSDSATFTITASNGIVPDDSATYTLAFAAAGSTGPSGAGLAELAASGGDPLPLAIAGFAALVIGAATFLYAYRSHPCAYFSGIGGRPKNDGIACP